MSNDIKEWYNGIPPITRFLFTASFGVTVVANFYKPLMSYLLLETDRIWYNFEVCNVMQF